MGGGVGGGGGGTGEGEVAREEGEEEGGVEWNGKTAGGDAGGAIDRRTKKRRANARAPRAWREAGARSEVRRSVAVGDARRRRGIAAFASFPGARDGRGGLARRRSAPRGRPGEGGGVEREGARTSRDRGRPAREPAASAFPETGSRGTRRDDRSEARRATRRGETHRGRFASCSSALGMYPAGGGP